MAQPTGYPTPCENCQIIFLDSFSEARAIQFCPLHAHAPAMRDQLRELLQSYEALVALSKSDGPTMRNHIVKARALLRQIEGQP